MEIFNGIWLFTFDFDDCKKIINTLQDIVNKIKVFCCIWTVWLHFIKRREFHLKRAFVVEIYKD
jgi:hypothetical protein